MQELIISQCKNKINVNWNIAIHGKEGLMMKKNRFVDKIFMP